MRLTVGPLPAAVYWRRRVVVLLGLAMVVLVISYSCSGNQGPVAGAGTQPPHAAPPTPTPTPSLPHPSTAPARPSQSAFTLPVGGATGPCTDPEMEGTA